MSSTYTGVPGNVSLGSAVQETIPGDGDARSASATNVGMQKLADYLEATRQVAILGSGLPLFEGFENATFPPAAPNGGWAAPSVNYGSDLAYQRDTSNPITGTASANRNSGQTASTNSSMSLTLCFDSPSRISFVLDLLCNASYGDHLDFYIDGVLTGKWSTVSNTVSSSGRWVSDPLREGKHTFDWRFVRGASGSVANEKARIDAVNVVPESIWMGDRANRILIEDDFDGPVPSVVTSWRWATITGTHAGTMAGSLNNPVFGAWDLNTAATAIGDEEGITLEQNQSGGSNSFSGWGTYMPFAEALISIPSLAGVAVEFGISAGGIPSNGGSFSGSAWIYDSTLGTDWRFRTGNAGTLTTNPTGITAVAATWTRLGLSVAQGLTNGNGALGMINGQSLPNTGGANHSGSTQNLPPTTGTANFLPYAVVYSRTAAAAKTVAIDYFKFLGQRAAGLIG
jgi:hypothetical protein